VQLAVKQVVLYPYSPDGASSHSWLFWKNNLNFGSKFDGLIQQTLRTYSQMTTVTIISYLVNKQRHTSNQKQYPDSRL